MIQKDRNWVLLSFSGFSEHPFWKQFSSVKPGMFAANNQVACPTNFNISSNWTFPNLKDENLSAFLLTLVSTSRSSTRRCIKKLFNKTISCFGLINKRQGQRCKTFPTDAPQQKMDCLCPLNCVNATCRIFRNTLLQIPFLVACDSEIR